MGQGSGKPKQDYSGIVRGMTAAVLILGLAYIAATNEYRLALAAGIGTGLVLLVYVCLDIYLFKSITSLFTAVGLVTVASVCVFLSHTSGQHEFVTGTMAAITPTIAFGIPAAIGYLIAVRISPSLEKLRKNKSR